MTDPRTDYRTPMWVRVGWALLGGFLMVLAFVLGGPSW